MKLYELSITLLLGCFLSIIMLTECKAQHVNLSTQAEVNAFGATNPTTVVGNLIIEESIPGNITDLTPLSTLTSVGGTLNIRFNTALTSLAGLNALTSVGGILQISSNTGLISLAGLDNLTSLGGDLSIHSNSVLTSLAGLDPLISVSGNLIITDNYGLTSLSGLDALTSVGGYLYIRFNFDLLSLTGLDALTSVGGFLYIFGNSDLAEFCPLFTLLTSVVGGLAGTYTVSGNAVNPTKQQIIDGGACIPVPVELTTFTATLTSSAAGFQFVNLNWQTATEVNNYGFEIQRSAFGDQSSEFEKIGFVEGHGNSNSPKDYSFTDKSAASGKYSYRLKQIDSDGKFEYSIEVEVDLGLPQNYYLEQNYPNPFNPSTKIKFNVPLNVKSASGGETSNVILKVFDVLGNEVATLIDEYKPAGSYEVKFNAEGLVSGVYFYRVHMDSFTQTKKMILMR